MLFNLSVEDEAGRTGHIDVIIRLTPLDMQGAAIHDDVALSAGTVSEYGSDSGGTGSRSTCLGDATAPFPYTGTYVSIVRHL